MAGYFLDSVGGVTWSTITPPNAAALSKEQYDALGKIAKEKRLAAFSAAENYRSVRAEYDKCDEATKKTIAEYTEAMSALVNTDNVIVALVDHLGRDEAPLPDWAAPPAGVSPEDHLSANRKARPELDSARVKAGEALEASERTWREALKQLFKAWEDGVGPLTRDEYISFESLAGEDPRPHLPAPRENYLEALQHEGDPALTATAS